MPAVYGCCAPACACVNKRPVEELNFVLEGPALHWTAVLFAGALTGSFLNVLVHRLPRMRRRRRLRDAGAEEDAERIWPGPYNLFLPRSHCPHCRAPIALQRNIPLLSWLLLRGVAPCCGARIPAQYFFLELLTVLAWPYAWRSWVAREGSADPGGLGGIYLIKFAIVAAGVFLVLAALVKALAALRALGTRR